MLALMEVAELKKKARRLARRYATTEGETRTAALRELAETLVDLREHFITDDGQPDWTGRTYDYRRAVSDIWRESGVPRDELPRARTAVGYHTSTVLRERLTDEQLDELGLLPTSAAERTQELRAAAAMARQAMRSGDVDVSEADVALGNAVRAMELLSAQLAPLLRSTVLTDEQKEAVKRVDRRIRAALK